jgi:predicted nucleic acid-binding Zn ribbon protein
MSSPAIQFKGTGWYITDYSSKGKPSDSAAPTTDAKKTDSGSTDAPAAKTDGGQTSSAAKSSSET